MVARLELEEWNTGLVRFRQHIDTSCRYKPQQGAAIFNSDADGCRDRIQAGTNE